MVTKLVTFLQLVKLEETGVCDDLAVTLNSVEEGIDLGSVLLRQLSELLVRDSDRHFLHALKQEG